MAFEVFISHAGEDKAIADAACTVLEAQGTRCWIAPRDIPSGSEWTSAVLDAIDRCQIMVLIFSEHFNVSDRSHLEVERFFNKKRPIVLLRIAEVSATGPMELYLRSARSLDALTPPLIEHLDRLSKTVRSYFDTVLNDVWSDTLRQQVAVSSSLSAPGFSPHLLSPHDAQQSHPSMLSRRYPAIAILCLAVGLGSAIYFHRILTPLQQNTISSMNNQTIVASVPMQATPMPTNQERGPSKVVRQPGKTTGDWQSGSATNSRIELQGDILALSWAATINTKPLRDSNTPLGSLSGAQNNQIAGVTPAVAAKLLPDQRCADESQYKSVVANFPTQITFVNQSNSSVRLYWLDYGGKRKLSGTIIPGRSYRQQTYMTHPWEIADLNDRCVAIYLPLEWQTQVTIQ
jgi:hypothetical protein